MGYGPLDVLKAEGIAAGINAMIGSKPEIRAIGDQYLEIVFTDAQRAAMVQYLDNRVGRLFDTTPQAAPTIQIAWGDVLIPWSVRYLAPAFIGVFALGFLSNAILFPKRR
jgi:hypothetical protein